MRLFIAFVGLLLCSASSFADVFVNNSTDAAFTIRMTSLTSPAGVERIRTATWSIAPNESSRLLLDGVALRASEIRWRIETSDGSTPATGRVWVSKADASGDVTLRVGESNLPDPGGKVTITNSTSRTVIIKEVRLHDQFGQQRTVSGYWTFEPGQAATLLDGTTTLRAHKFTATLSSFGQETRWNWTDADADEDRFGITINDSDLAPPGWWRHTASERREASFDLTTSRRFQTVVLTLKNLSRQGDVDIFVYDSRGNIVSRCRYNGTADDRCMIHSSSQSRYRVVVRAADADAPVEFQVNFRVISHADIVAEVAAEETAKALLGGLAVAIFGDEEDNERYWEKTIGNALSDAFVLGVLQYLSTYQSEVPLQLDPMSYEFSRVAKSLRGDSDAFVDIRGAFVDEFVARVKAACQ